MHKPESLRRKSSARLAAVQCLYRLRITDEEISAAKLAEDYLAQWQDDKESHSPALSRDIAPDRAFLSKLLAGAMEKQGELEELLNQSLTGTWKMERMSPLLIAILLAALYEMKYASSLKVPIITDEYVTLAGRFFEAPEVGFVNGLLDTLGKELRP